MSTPSPIPVPVPVPVPAPAGPRRPLSLPLPAPLLPVLTPPTAAPVPGDLVFFAADARSLADRAVAWRTRSLFVHVEVCVAPGESVGALSSGGVVRHALPAAPPVTAWARTSARCLPERLPAALAWLAAQVRGHDRYGWLSVTDDALSLLLPRGPFAFLRRRFDCAQLCAVFLACAGVALPPDLLAAPQLVTPGDLARVFAHVTTPVAPGGTWDAG